MSQSFQLVKGKVPTGSVYHVLTIPTTSGNPAGWVQPVRARRRAWKQLSSGAPGSKGAIIGAIKREDKKTKMELRDSLMGRDLAEQRKRAEFEQRYGSEDGNNLIMCDGNGQHLVRGPHNFPGRSVFFVLDPKKNVMKVLPVESFVVMTPFVEGADKPQTQEPKEQDPKGKKSKPLEFIPRSVQKAMESGPDLINDVKQEKEAEAAERKARAEERKMERDNYGETTRKKREYDSDDEFHSDNEMTDRKAYDEALDAQHQEEDFEMDDGEDDEEKEFFRLIGESVKEMKDKNVKAQKHFENLKRVLKRETENGQFFDSDLEDESEDELPEDYEKDLDVFGTDLLNPENKSDGEEEEGEGEEEGAEEGEEEEEEEEKQDLDDEEDEEVKEENKGRKRPRESPISTPIPRPPSVQSTSPGPRPGPSPSLVVTPADLRRRIEFQGGRMKANDLFEQFKSRCDSKKLAAMVKQIGVISKGSDGIVWVTLKKQ